MRHMTVRRAAEISESLISSSFQIEVSKEQKCFQFRRKETVRIHVEQELTSRLNTEKPTSSETQATQFSVQRRKIALLPHTRG
jgi:hypothetical protein